MQSHCSDHTLMNDLEKKLKQYYSLPSKHEHNQLHSPHMNSNGLENAIRKHKDNIVVGKEIKILENV